MAPPLPMKIVMVRHGESEANVAHVISDDPGRVVNLTAHGRVQAAEAAKRLCALPFTHAYASEFPRARQTAEILLRHHALDLHIDPRLNERLSGMDGQPVDAFNDLVRPDPLHTRPVRGESFVQQMERLRSFLDEVSLRNPGSVVLVVSHENPILAALALAAADPRQVLLRSIANCEAVELVWPV